MTDSCTTTCLERLSLRYNEAQLEVGRTEETCVQLDALAHSNCRQAISAAVNSGESISAQTPPSQRLPQRSKIAVARAASRCPPSPRNDGDVAKISPPEHCPDLYGLHVHRPTSTLHHHQPSNQNRVHFQTAYRIGVQIVRPTKEPPGGHSRPNQEREKSSNFLSWKKWWPEMIRPLVPKTKNETPHEYLRPYSFRSTPPYIMATLYAQGLKKKGTLWFMRDSCTRTCLERRSMRYNEAQLEVGRTEERHAYKLMLSHKKTTCTMRREKNAHGTEDLGASPSTTLLQ